MPRTFATERGEDRSLASRCQLEQLPDFGPHVAPPLPEAHAQAASQPGIEFREGAVVLREAKVVYPAPDILVEFADTIGHRDAPASPRELAQAMAKVLERLKGPIDGRAMEGKARERAVIGRPHRTLGLIDLQLQMLLEIQSYPRYPGYQEARTLR